MPPPTPTCGRYATPSTWASHATQNRGLELALGELIARNGADDVSAPDRLTRQVAFMDAHPKVVLLGCQMHLIEEKEPFGRSRALPSFRRGHPRPDAGGHRFLWPGR